MPSEPGGKMGELATLYYFLLLDGLLHPAAFRLRALFTARAWVVYPNFAAMNGGVGARLCSWHAKGEPNAAQSGTWAVAVARERARLGARP